jgi:hypothetical protein
MVNRNIHNLLQPVLCIAAAIVITSCAGSRVPQNAQTVSRLPQLYPDYAGITLPPNIAPLNFRIQEDGSRFHAAFQSPGGVSYTTSSRSGLIRIPLKIWRKLCVASRGNVLTITVFALSPSGAWTRYTPIVNHVAPDTIDSHLAYRLIDPGFTYWSDLGIFQRDLTTFSEKPILVNRLTGTNCMNCHAFRSNDPSTMMFHMRAQYGGTILLRNGQLEKIDTKTPSTISAGVYPAWHPGGKHIAFSVNKTGQAFASLPSMGHLVYDEASDLIVYDIEKKIAATSPAVSTTDKETCPAWSPDGKYLYFCSTRFTTLHEEHHYELKRISYDVATKKWGQVETVLPYDSIGASVSFPKISPDNRFVLFTCTAYGYFTITRRDADLCLLDLATGKWRRIDNVNSHETDSYHSWSGNGRWFVFASKRMDGLSARPFFCSIDSGGNCAKPFVLPQKDPNRYITLFKSYNVPELVSGAVKIPLRELKKVVYADPDPIRFDSAVNSHTSARNESNPYPD